MNGAKFCWSFHSTRSPFETSWCLNTLPGQSPTNSSAVSTVALRPAGDESSTVEPSASLNWYEATLPPPGAVISAWSSACDSARSWIWKSSTSACRSGSPYCERPIQLLVVLPMLDGLRVTLALVAT